MNQPPLGFTIPCEIVKVYDGDTPTIRFLGRETSIRLMNIVAPEIHDRNGNGTYVIKQKEVTGIQSRDALIEILNKGTRFVVHIPYADGGGLGEYFTFNRIRGHLFVDGQDAGDLMIKAGKALPNKEWK